MRTGDGYAIFCIFFEGWALDINCADYNVNSEKYRHDPDRPRADIGKTSRRAERAPLSLIELLQLPTCIRRLFANYLNDTTASGIFVEHLFFTFTLSILNLVFLTALQYSGPFCCD